jgi:hypothetical protein
MKKLIFSSVVALAFLTSCGSDADKAKSDSALDSLNKANVVPANGGSNVAAVKYQCPMKCEGEKTYDAAGKCPACQMDLKEVK